MDSAVLALIPAGGLALAGLGAVLLLVRARRLARHAAALEAEVERLQDRTWRLAESEERYRSLIEAQLDVIVQRDRRGDHLRERALRRAHGNVPRDADRLGRASDGDRKRRPAHRRRRRARR